MYWQFTRGTVEPQLQLTMSNNKRTIHLQCPLPLADVCAILQYDNVSKRIEGKTKGANVAMTGEIYSDLSNNNVL